MDLTKTMMMASRKVISPPPELTGNLTILQEYSGSNLGGSLYVCANDTHCFVSKSGGLIKVEISDPSNMNEVSYLSSSTYYGEFLDVDDEGYVGVLGNSDTSFSSVDGSVTPMVRQNTLTNTEYEDPTGVFSRGVHFFTVASPYDSISFHTRIADGTMQPLDTQRDTVNYNSPRGVTASDTHAFIVNSSSRNIVSFNYSSHTALVESDNLALVNARDVCINDEQTHVFVVSYTSNSIISVNVEDPTAMFIEDTLIDAVDLAGCSSCRMLDGIIVVSSFLNGYLTSVNAKDPTNLSKVDSIPFHTCRGIAISGTTAFCTGNNALTSVSLL